MKARTFKQSGQARLPTLARSNSGQAALIIILITAVVVTITASTINRTVTDVRISSEGVEGSQALYAAEAGLERGINQLSFQFMDYTNPECDDPALPSATACTITHLDGTTANAYYWYDFIDVPRNDPSVSFFSRGSIAAGDTKSIWLNSNITNENPFDNSGGNNLFNHQFRLTFTWPDMAAQSLIVETIRIYDSDSGVPIVLNVDRELNTLTSLSNEITIDNTGGGIYGGRLGLVRIHPISHDITDLVVNFTPTDRPFPVQGRLIDSRGVVIGSGEGSQSVVKRITAVKWRYEIPPYFDYVLYSAGNVTK